MSAKGMTATVLATQLAEAVAQDMENGGCDVAAGLYGPAASALLRSIAEDLCKPDTAAYARGVDAALHERFPSQCGHSLIALERSRQQLVEGFSDERDDRYTDWQLPRAAAVYALHDAFGFASLVRSAWPWDASWWKPTTPIRNLQKAGAMIAAEIDRRLRAGERE